MRVISADEIEAALSYPAMIDTLEAAFRTGVTAPPRHHHTIELQPGAPTATLLVMPAWTTSASGAAPAGRYLGVKTISVFPGNRSRGLPAVQGAYQLFSAETGVPLAIIDAPRLTAWRTAAASALASRYLSRPDARRLLLVGAGAQAPYLARAHASVRPIRDVVVWNRSADGAQRLVASLVGLGFSAAIADDLEAAVRSADIISTATLSRTPLIEGRWLAPGTHLDCVGAYRPDMRETDDAVMQRARIWVDTLAGGLAEAGDIVMPLSAGVIGRAAILGELRDLVAGPEPKRSSDRDITLFKSVGASIEDLAAAVAVYEHVTGGLR